VSPSNYRSLQVLFDYYLEPSLAADAAFVAASLAASDRVQQEDITLCESVQRGLASPAYDAGRCGSGGCIGGC
jgi:choline monooxygenase